MPVASSTRLLGQRILRQSALSGSVRRRGFKSDVGSTLKIPDFAFAFDIDGVLVRASRPLPGAAESLSLLEKQRIPFILLTNGGGMSEWERIRQLNDRLGLELDHSRIIQSHTPFAELVEGTKEQQSLEDKCVLVVGGPGDKCRHVAKQYGFKSVVTPADIFMAHPSIWPFSKGFADYYKDVTQPVTSPVNGTSPGNLKVDAILVFNDPRDWALDIQVIVDLLLSRQGFMGTYSNKNNREDLPNRGYQQDGQPQLYFSNPDLLWAAAYHLPRLGQGGFIAALQGVWNTLTGGPAAGVQLQSTIIGKPHRSTYEFAENRLIEQRENSFKGAEPVPLRNVYMIGDNPESDIRGANSFNSTTGAEWTSILSLSFIDCFKDIPNSYDSRGGTWDPNMEQSSSTALPHHTKDGEEQPDGTAPPSKNALKKAAKEKAKAEKAAQRAAQEKAQAQASQAVDTAKDLYGKMPESDDFPQVTNFPQFGTDDFCGKEVTVIARVDNARVQSAKLAFLMLRQQGKKVQAVIFAQEPISKQMVKWTGGLNVNSIVQVTGIVKKPEIPVNSATYSNMELHIRKVYMVAQAAQQLPMQVKDAERPPPESNEEGQVDAEGAPIVTLKTRLDNRILDLQTETSQAITWISSGVAQLFAEYMLKSGARWIFTSKLSGAATEGGADVFELGYFKRKAYLSQSPQLGKQMCIAGDMMNVFEIGPVFRAEESNTHRHLTEFIGLDFERTFQHHYHEVLSFAEELLVFILSELKERFKDQIEVIQKSYPKAGDFRLPHHGKALRLKYVEGIALLKEAGVDVSEQERFENDLTTAMEKQLGRIIREKHDTDFYVLDKFPSAVRPFYTKACPDDPTFSNSYDFFMRGEEIMSGAQRINDVEELEEAMKARGLDPMHEGFDDYLAAFRQACPPHAGGGLGLNRIVMFFLGLPNIRLATLFPRDPQRLRP
ncbi:aspartyl/asparaginyl-tRNA synthetase [Emydomyces testavorans]|uniref:Probable aspartate--tRNA ligase, cytoplasmic n=1 Tax=Emydomyces testavorans TaxID=2070801 RepID=A0AAF0DND2_9EURO|nr:aspartyl/asparaginyl-tRNA synthetase [Emydomyces testavorans]